MFCRLIVEHDRIAGDGEDGRELISDDPFEF